MKKITSQFCAAVLCIALLSTNAFAQIEKGNPAASYYHDRIILPDNREVEIKEGYTALFINGTLVTDYEAVIKNDSALVPVRLICQELGATVNWDGDKKEVTIKKDRDKIILTIDKGIALVNGIETALDYPAILYKDTAYAPLSLICECLDAAVSYVPPISPEYVYYYDTQMPVSPANTIIRSFPNIIIDEKYDAGKAATMEEAMKRTQDICMEGLENFTESIMENLKNAGEDPDRLSGELKSIEKEINRMLYIGEVSRYYKFTIGPYDILYDKYNDKIFFIIYSSGTIVKEVDIHDDGLFINVFIVG